MREFKIGDKVVLKKDIPLQEFAEFANEDIYIKEIKNRKFVTIMGFTNNRRAIRVREVEQFWRAEWFVPFTKEQLEFDFNA
jgi:hypothetical protein